LRSDVNRTIGLQKSEGQGVVLIATSCFRLQELTTPALTAPPLLNQQGSFSSPFGHEPRNQQKRSELRLSGNRQPSVQNRHSLATIH